MKPSSEEEEILAFTRDLLQQGSIRSCPTSVVWKRAGHRVWSDYCVVERDSIVLPSSLRGRLSPEEWKPIIASSMMLTQPGESRREFLQGFRRIGATGGLAIGSSTLIIAVISLVSGIGLQGIFMGRGGGYFFLILGLPLTVGVIGFVYGWHQQRPHFTRVILEADLRASSIVGREHFVQVLSKIDSYRFRDVERAKNGHSRFNFRPSITDRISNLQASPPERPIPPTVPSHARATNWLTLKRLLYLTILPVVIFYIVLAALAADGFNIEVPMPIALVIIVKLVLGIVEGTILYYRFLRKMSVEVRPSYLSERGVSD